MASWPPSSHPGRLLLANVKPLPALLASAQAAKTQAQALTAFLPKFLIASTRLNATTTFIRAECRQTFCWQDQVTELWQTLTPLAAVSGREQCPPEVVTS